MNRLFMKKSNKKFNKKFNIAYTTILCIKFMLKKNKLKTIFWVIFSIVLALIPPIIIILNKEVINEIADITKEGIMSEIISTLLLIAFIQIFNAIVDSIKDYLYEIIKKDTDYYLFRKLYSKLIVTELEKFEDSGYYNLVSLANGAVLSNGIDNIKYMVDIFSSLVTIAGVIVVLSIVHWSLPVALLVSMVPGFIGIVIAKTMSYNNSVDLIPSQRAEAYISSLFFNKNTLKEVKIFKLGQYLLQKWKDTYEFIRESKIKISKTEKKIAIAASSIMQLSTAGVSIYLVYNISGGNITVGDYVALTTAMTTFLSSIGLIAESIGELFERSLYNTSFFEVIGDEDENRCIDTKNIGTIEDINLRNITFKYPNADKDVIRNLSLNIKKGEKIALVGNNGSGKSTLINILMGIYTKYNGIFEINGQELNDGLVEQYQSKLTVVLQDFNRYKFSIKENVGLGNLSQKDNKKFIENKLKEVDLYDYVTKLPNSIETILSKEFEEGTELSGGQWQKIAIARAMSKNSEIIIFDEPTSALDPLAELEVFNLLNKVSKDKTTIMISHRLGVTRYADRICFMEDGKIIEQGTHEELINMGGKYKKMYEAQAKWYQ